MAPALTKGLRGMPAFMLSSCRIELKARPEGSRRTRVQSWSPWRPSAMARPKTLETDWIENGVGAVPGRQCWVPSARQTEMPNWFGSMAASSGM
jgi:hypothetical protein